MILLSRRVSSGGDLEKHLRVVGKFSEAETKFYGAQVVLGLEVMRLSN